MRLRFFCGLIIIPFFNSVAQDTTIVTGSGSITFSNMKAYGFTLAYNSPVTASGFLCLRALQPLDTAYLNQYFGPSSGNTTVPARGSGVGFAKVFQSSAPAFFNVREVVENTDYYFAIVPYHLVSSTAAFVIDSAIIAHVKSSASNYGSYYSAMDFSSPGIISQLTQLLQNHTLVDYTDFKNNIVPAIFERDTAGQKKVVNCQYSGQMKMYSGSFDFVALNYSREHTLARSWMPTGGATGSIEGSDYHNLLLTNLDSANSVRSNYPLGEVVQQTYSFLDCKKGLDSAQQTVFEPRGEARGDLARAIFYEMVCYNGLGGNWGLDNLLSYGPSQDVNVLLSWHFNDPPDAFEKAKHEYIYSLQHNRNPFIDFPDLVNCIDFNELIKSGTCPAVGIETPGEEPSVLIFPNPADDVISVRTENRGEVMKSYLSDLNGKILIEKNFLKESNSTEINVSALPAGFYILNFIFRNNVAVHRKILVE